VPALFSRRQAFKNTSNGFSDTLSQRNQQPDSEIRQPGNPFPFPREHKTLCFCRIVLPILYKKSIPVSEVRRECFFHTLDQTAKQPHDMAYIRRNAVFYL